MDKIASRIVIAAPANRSGVFAFHNIGDNMPAQVEIGGAMGAGAPVYPTVPYHSERLVTTASAQTTKAARSGDYARITAIDAALVIAVGANPTAVTSGAGMRYIVANTSLDIGPLKDGDLIACIDA